MTRFFAAALAVIFAVTGWTALADDKPAFTPEQKTEIGKLIKDYLIKNPEAMGEIIQSWQAHQRKEQELAQRRQIDDIRKAVIANKAQVFRGPHDYVAGNPDGDVTMVEFFDYNCGFCKRSLGDVLTLIEKDTKLRVVMKEFPILGPGSLYASRAAIASKKQNKYWPFHVALMRAPGVSPEQVLAIAKKTGIDIDKLKKDMEAPEVRAEIDANLALAQKLGINGTPAFVIADRPIPGAVGLNALTTQIADVRKQGGCKIC